MNKPVLPQSKANWTVSLCEPSLDRAFCLDPVRFDSSSYLGQRPSLKALVNLSCPVSSSVGPVQGNGPVLSLPPPHNLYPVSSGPISSSCSVNVSPFLPGVPPKPVSSLDNSLSSLSLRQLRRKYKQKAHRIPINYNPISSEDYLIIQSKSNSVSLAVAG